MSKIKSEMASRCELALMGKVVPCVNDEVQQMTSYIYEALGRNLRDENVLDNQIRKYSKENLVKYLVCNTVEGMRCITYLLETETEDEEEYFPAPFDEDYGSGYPCAFCYVLNVDFDEFSEFGDCFFEKRSDGYYHRVS